VRQHDCIGLEKLQMTVRKSSVAAYVGNSLL
jgi:hypothetical protein